jgi:antitoxin (DNA-binding transcriptional repressor) of toxin-antitoxin stability system
MDFLSVRDFRNSPQMVWKKLAKEGKLVITNNGKPQALLIPVDGTSLEDILNDMVRIQAKRALREIQRQSAINRTDKMTMEEIDAEIAVCRREKRSQNSV